MADLTAIESILKGVLDPELGSDIVDLGMVRDIRVDGTTVFLQIALTIAACPMRDQIEQDVVRKVTALPDVDDVVVDVVAMTQEQRSEVMSRARRHARDQAAPTMVNPLTRVLAISSGKGGVGKSSVSVNVAAEIRNRGFEVGLLDADIWGFSVPRMLGVSGTGLTAGPDRKIVPAVAHGIHVVSTGLIVDTEDTALMWRGLMLSKALEQFLNDVAWPRDLDYLVLDMPPGTGDIQMALSRLLPQAEMVVVTTPQKAAQKVAARVADMARRSFMPVVGVIENMSGFTTARGEHYDVFGVGGGRELADELGVPLLGQIPLDPRVVEGGDGGQPTVLAHRGSPSADALASVVDRLLALVPPAEDETCTSRIALIAEELSRLG